MDLEAPARLVRRYGINTVGRDIAVGDIHGQYLKLKKELKEIGFDKRVDRLFGLGDLVDRGPDSHLALKWLNKQWFHSVCGNHDDYIVRFAEGGLGSWKEKAGRWFMQIPPHRQDAWCWAMNRLPVAIEVMTANGKVGLMHASIPGEDWEEAMQKLESPTGSTELKLYKNRCMWSRTHYNNGRVVTITGVKAVVHGHEPVLEHLVRGNVHYIDTTGGRGDKAFTFLDLSTLTPIARKCA